jgi:hypothetical protein
LELTLNAQTNAAFKSNEVDFRGLYDDSNCFE